MNRETPPVHWKKITLIGVGLLGGSLGLALKQRRLAECVAGFVRRPASLQECEASGAVDHATLDLHGAVEGADLVVFCTPIAQMRQLAKQLLPNLKRGAIVTDVGSVKESVVRGLESLIKRRGAHFVGSHPMAGAEKAGVLAARADLFAGAVCVVTPTPNTNKAAQARIEKLWASVGARVLTLPPRIHDQLVSRSSHLPHVVAAGLATLVLDPKQPPEQGLLCATGFRDTTRIASGSPEMWRDIALANHKNIAAAIGQFSRDLARFRRALMKGDADAVARYFENAKSRRDSWPPPGKPSPE